MSDDILDRLRHAESLTRGPLYSLAVEAADEIEQLQARLDAVIAAGNELERSHMKLHRWHHGDKCEHCAPLIAWWDLTLPLEVKKP